MKNITLSAEESWIEEARRRARKENKTLNLLFREWLNRYIGQQSGPGDYRKLMHKFSYADAGRKFSRDDMNER